jgi:hypothetical protein
MRNIITSRGEVKTVMFHTEPFMSMREMAARDILANGLC